MPGSEGYWDLSTPPWSSWVADPEVVEAVDRVRDVVDAVGSFPSDRLALLAFQKLDDLRTRAQGILEPNLALLGAVASSASVGSTTPDRSWPDCTPSTVWAW